MNACRLVVVAAVLPLLTACLLVLPPPPPPPALIIAAPPVCSIAAAANLQLPATEGARQRAPKSGPLDLAQVHTVNRPLPEIAVWQGFADGWSRLSLQLGSKYASAISLRLHDVHLPPQAQVWLCSAGATVRLGPLSPDAQGELWTPPVPGEQVRLEVWAPDTLRGQLRAQLSDVYAGYR